jgi:hypothetical protein
VPAIQKFLDTFTDANGTALTSHEPDSQSGTPYTFAAAGVEIQSNKAQYSHANITAGRIAICGADVELAVGDDVYSDITFGTTSAGSASVMEAALLIHQAAAAFQEYAVHARYKDSTKQLQVGADDDGIAWGQQIIGTVACPDAQIRLGVTITGDMTLDVWVEPYGGGTRTAVGSFTATNDYSANKRLGFGMYVEAPSGETLTVTHEDFTAETPSNKCFETDYTCASEPTIPAGTQVTATAPSVTDVVPTKRIQDDDDCISSLSLADY